MSIGIGKNINLGNTQSLSKSVKSAKLKAKADAIGMVAEIVGMVGSSLITSSYNKKNAQYQAQIESELLKLSDLQREELRDNLLKVSNSNQRLSIVVNYLADKLGSESSLNLKSRINENLAGAVNKETKQIYLFIGIAVAVLIGIIAIKKIKK
jgi:hypothetical protein